MVLCLWQDYRIWDNTFDSMSKDERGKFKAAFGLRGRKKFLSDSDFTLLMFKRRAAFATEFQAAASAAEEAQDGMDMLGGRRLPRAWRLYGRRCEQQQEVQAIWGAVQWHVRWRD